MLLIHSLTDLLILFLQSFSFALRSHDQFKASHWSRRSEEGGGGGRRMWIKKFLNVNIINFEKVDKPKVGGSDNVDKVILLNFGTF